MLDRPMMERRELRAGQFDQLDPVALPKRPRRNDLVDGQGDRVSLLRFEVRFDDRPVGVSFAVADACVSRLSRTTAWMRYRPGLSWPSESGNPTAGRRSWIGSPGFQSSTSVAKNGCGRNQSGPSRGSADDRSGPSITYTRGDRLALHRRRTGHLEGQALAARRPIPSRSVGVRGSSPRPGR